MKKKKFLISTMLILSTYLLIIMVNEYRLTQAKLFLESNKLYSTDHLFVKDTFKSIAEDKFKNSSDLSIFISLDSQNNDEVRGYFSKNYSNDLFPIRKGNFFSKVDSKEALVGKSVHTISKNGDEYYEYDNETYKVIGYLGITNPSFLDNDVLINSNDLFKKKTPFLTIDGKKIITAYQQKATEKDAYQDNTGLDRKINSDYFSPLIFTLSLFIAFACTVLIAYISFTDLKKENYINYILGISIFTKYKTNLLYLLSTCIMPILFCVLVLPLFRIISIHYLFLFSLFFIQLLLMCFIFTCFFINEERSNLHGVTL